MRIRRVSLLILPLMLISCKHNQNTSTSTEPARDLIYDVSLPKVEDDCYDFGEKSFVDFPEFNTSNTDLSFDLSEDGTYYIVSNREYKLASPTLIIPSSYNGLPVKEIAAESFAYKTWLKTVYIPSSIEIIRAGAFNGSSLQTVYYDAKNVQDLNGRNWVFFPSNTTTDQIDFYIGPNVERIPNRLLFPKNTEPSQKPLVKHLYFSKNSKLKEIGDYAFYGLSDTIVEALPDSVEKIGNYAFYQGNIDNLDLPKSLLSIGEHAFAFNPIEHIKFNSELSIIDKNAFYNCDKLIKIDLKETKLETIEDNAFRNCTNVKEIVFNDELKSIGKRVFEGTEELVYVDLGKNITSIGENSFYNCVSLKAIRLNKNLKSIGNYAFFNAIKLEKLIVESIKLDDFAANNNIFSNVGVDSSNLLVAFTKGTTTIPARMFLSSSDETKNAQITRLVIEKTVTKIGEYAFFGIDTNVDYAGNMTEFTSIDIGNYNNTLSKVVCYNN